MLRLSSHHAIGWPRAGLQVSSRAGTASPSLHNTSTAARIVSQLQCVSFERFRSDDAPGPEVLVSPWRPGDSVYVYGLALYTAPADIHKHAQRWGRGIVIQRLPSLSLLLSPSSSPSPPSSPKTKSMSQKQQPQPEWAPKRTLAECRAILTAPGMPFELERKLVHGRLLTVYKHMEPNLRTYFLKFTTAHAEKEYLVYGRERYTYAQVRAQAEQLADTFWETYGVRKGDRASPTLASTLTHRNSRDHHTQHPRGDPRLLGARAPRRGPDVRQRVAAPGRLEHCIRLTAPKLLILDAERAGVLLPRLPALLADGALRLAGVIVARHEGPLPASWNVPVPVRTWASLLDSTGTGKSNHEHAGAWKNAPAAHPDDPAAILFTSGTTSRPRAVLTSQRAFLSNTYSGMYLGLFSRLRDG
ncbi:hypothetical protein EVG20_g10548, partial [Dentipellis fragilis]